MTKINNMPKEVREYIVARRDDNWELWYWDSFNDRERANRVALEIGGELFTEEWLE